VAGARAGAWLPLLFGGLGVMFTAIGGVMVARAIRDVRLEARLRERGVRTNGRVSDLRGMAFRINNVQQWRLHYEYQDSQGGRHRKTIVMSEDEAREWKNGDAGNVLYDPDKPAESVWLGRES
jgi:hypothetical protein